MPKYRKDYLAEGISDEEQPRGWGNEEFTKKFGIKCGFGPPKFDEGGNLRVDASGRPMREWNRCWFNLPHEWIPAVTKLIEDVKNKYIVETAEMDTGDPRIEVRIDQIKSKFGGLRFYFSAISKEIRKDVNSMVAECEKQLAIDDETYNVPY